MPGHGPNPDTNASPHTDSSPNAGADGNGDDRRRKRPWAGARYPVPYLRHGPPFVAYRPVTA